MGKRSFSSFVVQAVLIAALIGGERELQAQTKPIEVALGYNYALDDQGNGFTNASGFYGAVNWARFERIGFTFSHESYWGAYQRSGLNQHVYLLGATLKLRKGEHRSNPFLQLFGGDTRASYQGTIENQPTFELVAGADIHLQGNLSFELIPAEYAFAHGSTGALSNYQAGVGLEYTFKSKQSE